MMAFNPKCEICGAPATGNCSGLDVAELWFCEACIKYHERICPEIRAGHSQIHKPG